MRGSGGKWRNRFGETSFGETSVGSRRWLDRDDKERGLDLVCCGGSQESNRILLICFGKRNQMTV
jgi:hypothetical protein